MAEQLELYPVEAAPQKKVDNTRRRWENGFQRWSTQQFLDGSVEYGACGYGCMQGTLCIQQHCAWWCEYAKCCSVPLIAGILADSTICQNVWEKEGADNDADDS